MTHKIARGVSHLQLSIANVFFVDRPNGGWVLVDTAVPGKAKQVQQAADKLYGPGARPEAILLTHGHFDHAGSACDLADQWHVPIYAHTLELPYLTRRSCYPPADPTAPGFMSFVSRFFSPKPFNLGGRVRPLEFGSGVPGLPDWEWHHTPGHTPGHVSFFRPEGKVLLAGDAFATMNLDSGFAIIAKKQRVSRPPTPMTCDWIAAATSVRRLASLKPIVLGCGHGLPMSGSEAAAEFQQFARNFRAPRRGRYVSHPARADETGVTYLPPKPADPVPAMAAGLGIAAVAGSVLAMALRKSSSFAGDES